MLGRYFYKGMVRSCLSCLSRDATVWNEISGKEGHWTMKWTIFEQRPLENPNGTFVHLYEGRSKWTAWWELNCISIMGKGFGEEGDGLIARDNCHWRPVKRKVILRVTRNILHWICVTKIPLCQVIYSNRNDPVYRSRIARPRRTVVVRW